MKAEPPELGPWEPLSVAAVSALFNGAGFPWWVAGGHALELHVGRSWRDHADIDVGVRRVDGSVLHRHLRHLDVCVAADGRLSPWSGETLDEALHQNNLWCRRDGRAPWMLDIVVGAGDDAAWRYRKAPSTSLLWSEAVRRTGEGLPFLAPHVQLLFKSTARREKDDIDADVVIPTLSASEREWLGQQLPAHHPWLELLSR